MPSYVPAVKKKDLLQEVKVGYFGYVIVLLWLYVIIVCLALIYISINSPENFYLPINILIFTKVYKRF